MTSELNPSVPLMTSSTISPLMHDINAVAHTNYLGKFGRNHDNCLTLCCKPVHQMIDFQFCSHINTTVGSSKIKFPGQTQPFCQYHLLLIAAGQIFTCFINAGCSDTKLLLISQRNFGNFLFEIKKLGNIFLRLTATILSAIDSSRASPSLLAVLAYQTYSNS